MTFFGPDLRNGLPIGLGSVAGFGIAPQFSPASLFAGGVNGAWYDPSDPTVLFSDRAGTTPCGTPGGGSVVPVGLMLDKSQGLVLGSETVTNGGPFTATTGWTAGSGGTLSVSSQNLRITNGIADGGDAVFGASAPTAGKWYKVQFTIVARTTSAASRIIFGGNVLTGLNAGSYTYYLRATTTGAFTLSNGATGVIGEFADYNNISVRELAGNHAIAANDTTARPELSARVNLLTYSEQFDNAVWTKNGASVSGNTAIAPDGTLTADSLIENAGTIDYGKIVQTITVAASALIIINAKPLPGSAKRYLAIQTLTNGSNYAQAVFDCAGSGQVTEQKSVGLNSVTSANISGPDANGYYKCTVLFNRVDTTINIWVVNTGTPNDYYKTRTGDGVSGFYIWGADLRPTNIGTAMPAYQRIADQYTYDNVGFPRYLAFNGTSSAMSTPANVNLSGTDKATVFAGVRKLSDAAAGMVTEFASSLLNGTFNLAAPSANVSLGANFGPAVRGSGATFYGEDAGSNPAPKTGVLTSAYDLAAADKIDFRINGATASVVNNGGAAGTGNFGAYPLFVGARNNASIFLNGNIYSLLVVGSAVSAGNITATESWVNNKVGGAY